MTVDKDKEKHRQAAFKAWKTIKKKKREKAARNTKKITQFIEPRVIEKIKHPEMTDSEEILEPVWKGNRIAVLFHKTPPSIACG